MCSSDLISAGETIQIIAPVTGVSGSATTIAVNPAIINNPWRTRDGSRVQLPSTLTGDNALPVNVVAMFEGLQTFSANSGLSTSSTIENFASSVVAFEANRRAATTTALSSQTIIRDNFDRRVKDDSGVNVDQELAFMLQVQNSYSASARTMTAIKDMMDELIGLAAR